MCFKQFVVKKLARMNVNKSDLRIFKCPVKQIVVTEMFVLLQKVEIHFPVNIVI